MCRLCSGTKVVYSEIMEGVTTAAPCPNCTGFTHRHYKNELEALKHE